MPSTPIKRKGAGGRPTKYTPELVKRAHWYIRGGYEECGDVIPSVAGLALEIGVSKETCHAWRAKHPEFSGLLDDLHHAQERKLLSGGLSGAYNATIAKLVLNKHDYVERAERDHRSSDGSMSPQRIERVVVTVREDAADQDG